MPDYLALIVDFLTVLSSEVTNILPCVVERCYYLCIESGSFTPKEIL